ncbi:pentapeptide repeat-containing protein [Streptomyces sediminimaris]|uniref:pentapeptide repeat-containing protein n=1 Tax=Streptomyces sediminimaris TaxID=3383721 RepID=UPI00399A4D8F
MASYQGVWEPGVFAGQTFIGVDFSSRCLVGADFSGAICKDCDFSDSDLSMANFSGADLYRCNFVRSVLYAVELDGANLTRADFRGAFTYGWLLNSSANVTYAKLLDFGVESRRRSVTFSVDIEHNVRDVPFGQVIQDTKDLCLRSYQVGGYGFTFDELDPQEAALQRSQIYNRLKRLYRENHNGQAAVHCQYNERYYLTRSFYRYSALTGGQYRDQIVRTIIRTGFAYTAEFLSGYGVRPLRILRNLGLLFLAFWLTACLVSIFTSGSGVIYQAPRPAAAVRGSVSPASAQPRVRNVSTDLGKGESDVGRLAQYSSLGMVSPEVNQFTPYGVMIPVSLLYFALSACLLALLFSAVFLRLLSE